MELENIKQILGEPYYENPLGLVYKADCLASLKKIDGLILDSTITSPPYNIGKVYETIKPVDEYVDWLVSVCSEVYRLTKDNGNFVLNVGYLSVEGKGRAVPIPYLLWDKVGFYLNQEIVWNYGAGVAAKRYLSPRNEKVLWYVKDPNQFTFNLDAIRDPDVKYPNQKKNGKLRCNTLGKNPSDVWQIAKATSGTNRSAAERTSHPAQFPEDLIKRIILGFTNENDLILDPFFGSGTTGVVAIEYNRRFLGFEINEEYCEIAKERLQNKYNELQNKLF